MLFLPLNTPKKIPPAAGWWYLAFLFKKNRLRRAFIIFKISEARIWGLRESFFKQKCGFCLKIPPKNFRLRRAGETWLLLVTQKIRLRRAFIIHKFSKSFCFYYLHKILQSFLLALIISFLREGDFIISWNESLLLDELVYEEGYWEKCVRGGSGFETCTPCSFFNNSCCFWVFWKI